MNHLLTRPTSPEPLAAATDAPDRAPAGDADALYFPEFGTTGFYPHSGSDDETPDEDS